MTDVLLELGKTWVFAQALDHPGWCRRGKGEDAALDELLAYADRYARVVPGFQPGRLRVVARVPGTGTTDFGAPDAQADGDDRPATPKQLEALQRCWDAFDAIVAASAPTLRKGPRGGGRDRDPIVEHVREAERAYGRAVGVKVPPRTPWPEQRAALLDGLRKPSGRTWGSRYATRRIAWHVLDHAWEVEDKQP